MDSDARLHDVVLAFRAAKYEECLILAAPLLSDIAADPQILLMAAQSYARLGHAREAAHFYEIAAARVPQSAGALLSLAARMKAAIKDQDGALALLKRAQALGQLDGDGFYLLRRLLRGKLDLDAMARLDAAVLDGMQGGDPKAFDADDPFFHLMWCGDEALNAQVVHMPSGHPFTVESRARRRAMPHSFAEKIRVGYLSGDVSDQHATMILFQGVLDRHDREKFDVTLFCFTDESVARSDRGFRARCSDIVDIRSLSDDAAREAIRARGIDILVDMKGHTRGARVDLVNSGLAPVQVNWLGFPGSCTGIDCDYIIGDPTVLQEGSQRFYHESFCRLPETYQPNDCMRRPLPSPDTRQAHGLPENAFVFASFNDIRKITASVAGVWAEILKTVDNSCLWMLCRDAVARVNFADWMAGRGVAVDRIIFADRVDYAAHLARLGAADLALDTFPYTGHTTTSDQLWAGLPVVSLRGSNFASRVSESLLGALGLPELVASDRDDFVRLAVELARDPVRLASLRRKIEENRFRAPLFDTERFTRHLESAFETMVARAREGIPPAPFDVEALPARKGNFSPA